MPDPIAVFACNRRSARDGCRPCDGFRPRTLFPGLSSAGSITSTTLGSPETHPPAAHLVAGGRARDSYVRSVPPRVRAPDPGALRPKTGATRPSPRPFLAVFAAALGHRSALLRRTFVLDGSFESLATKFATRQQTSRNRWPKIATPTGFESSDDHSGKTQARRGLAMDSGVIAGGSVP